MKRGGMLLLLAGLAVSQPVRVGSKSFAESRLLGELAAQALEAQGMAVERRLGLGGTLVAYRALTAGEIDLYPDYTGTLWTVVLGRTARRVDPLQVYFLCARELKRRGLRVFAPLGFQNRYALAMRADKARALGVETLSDLVRAAPQLTAGFSHEFLRREDGWPGLREAYGLRFRRVRGIEHTLAYEALARDEIQVMDAYTTDGKLLRYRLRLLRDDRGFFPPYHAVYVVREGLLRRKPEVEAILEGLSFRLSEAAMQRLNYEVETEGRAFGAVAAAWLREAGVVAGPPAPPAARRVRLGTLLRLTGEHLGLTAVGVLLASLFGIPLGLWASRVPWLARLSLGAAGVLQTVPSLALLALLLPFLGLGWAPAVAALFLYALLPILRNTVTGVQAVPASVREAALGLGLGSRELLRWVELPLAAPHILAGVRTAGVISVGVAVLAAFVGAGGLGEPIVTGLQLNDPRLLLAGAVPAALLALLVDTLLGGLAACLRPGRRRSRRRGPVELS